MELHTASALAVAHGAEMVFNLATYFFMLLRGDQNLIDGQYADAATAKAEWEREDEERRRREEEELCPPRLVRRGWRVHEALRL